ncbi:Lrp/AsnC family transcriptional regulator [Kutzneria sp. NPDC052558]|uniref:Lrp/AsnC family transcriptional regulator n=1 Tax=Kutzneria sp. NPDC052558 TaxID=3364121 RepID=UPI0037C92E51
MILVGNEESNTIDELDARIIRCLQLAPRTGFARVAAVLGVSEPTVARRYRRLTKDGSLRVKGVIDPRALGESSWQVRVRCRPQGTNALAQSLAARADVGWVAITAGGSEVFCAVRALSAAQRDDLLVHRLPRSTPVLGIEAAVMLHQYTSYVGHTIRAFQDVLSDSEIAALDAAPAPRKPTSRVRLEPHDEAILAVLARDGRASYAELASAAAISEGRAARALAALLAHGVVSVDVDIAPEVLGRTTRTAYWLRVTPALIDAAGAAFAAMPEVTFAAAISGPHNLYLSVVGRDLTAVYAFLHHRVGSVDGVRSVEVSPIMRQVKQAGSLMAGDRFVVSDHL